MAARGWFDLPLAAPLHQNAAPQSLRRAHAILENTFVNRAGAHTPFPGLRRVVSLPKGVGRVFLYEHEFQNDMIAVTTSGRVFRIHRDFTYEDVTGVPVEGGGRVTFAQTSRELIMAAGGALVRLAKGKTDILSVDAPQRVSHVVHIEGFTLALEVGTGLFFQSAVNDARSWDPIDVFATTVKPDDVQSLVTTPRLSLYVAGPRSIEQFEAHANGVAPFFRRRGIGVGIKGPHLLIATDRGSIAVNRESEVVRLSELAGQPLSDDVQRPLEDILDWSEAWLAEVRVKGHDFVLLQAPNAKNRYGTMGVTYIYEYHLNRWAELYGWDEAQSRSSRWPGWSVARVYDRVFAGGEACIYHLDPEHSNNDGAPMIRRWRSGAMRESGRTQVDDMRVIGTRGLGGPADGREAQILLFEIGDDGRMTHKISRGLGGPGDREMAITGIGAMGEGYAHVFGYEISDECLFEISNIQIKTSGTDQ